MMKITSFLLAIVLAFSMGLFGQAKGDSKGTAQKTSEKAAPKAKSGNQCQAKTKDGDQCKRSASPGSQFCWQHGGKKAAGGAKKKA